MLCVVAILLLLLLLTVAASEEVNQTINIARVLQNLHVYFVGSVVDYTNIQLHRQALKEYMEWAITQRRGWLC